MRLTHLPLPEPPGSPLPLGTVSHTAHRVHALLFCFRVTTLAHSPPPDGKEAWSPASGSNVKHLVEVAFNESVMGTELHIYETYKVRDIYI